MDLIAKYIDRAVRFLLWFVVVWCGMRLLRWIFSSGPAAQRTAARAPEGAASNDAVGPARRLVRDPVCGTYVAERLALPLRADGELLHFCSPACREQYLQRTRKLAANG